MSTPVDVVRHTAAPSPIDAVVGVWRLVIEPLRESKCRSISGHLIHLLLSGEYHLKTNGRDYHVRAGDLIYYFESEEVECSGTGSEVVFLSVGFQAPSLKPPPLSCRVLHSNAAIRKAFAALETAWCRRKRGFHELSVYAELLKILVQIRRRCPAWEAEQKEVSRWWDVEERLREKRLFRPTLAQLGDMSHRSRASVVRLCREATGQSPMQRVQKLRMEEAHGLLQFSTMTITEVAEYLGYPRMHEFSREFSRYYGMPPSRMQDML